jgi:hypothetical protein
MDTAASKVEFMPNLPTPRGSASVAAHNNRVYVLGGGTNGFTFLASADCWDIEKKAWRALPPLPAGLSPLKCPTL